MSSRSAPPSARRGFSEGAASQAPYVSGERVTAAPDGLDQFRVAGVGFDLLAQAADVIVDAALERAEIAMLAEVEQLVAGQHPLGMRDEGEQQIIFSGRERDLASVLADQLAFSRPQLGQLHDVSQRLMYASTHHSIATRLRSNTTLASFSETAAPA